MVLSPAKPFRLSTLVAVSVLAMSVSGATLADHKTKPAKSEQTSTQFSAVEFNIASVTGENSSIDDATLHDIVNGHVLENADAIASLKASKITIPSISYSVKTTIDGDVTQSKSTISDIVLTNIVDGRAAEVTIGGYTAETSGETNVTIDGFAASVKDFDLNAMLAFFGIIQVEDKTSYRTIYRDYNVGSGNISGDEFECEVVGATIAEVKARPISVSFDQMLALFNRIAADPDETPSVDDLRQIGSIYVDILTGLDTSTAEIGPVNCEGDDADGEVVRLGIEGMTFGAFKPNLYPSLEMRGLSVTSNDVDLALENFTMKNWDLTAPLNAIKNLPGDVDEVWFEKNFRSFIPAFEGFAFSGLSLDAPDPENPEIRVGLQWGSFDLTLGNYINGIPSLIKSSAKNVVADIPEDIEDEAIKQLIDLGVTRVDLGYNIDIAWDEVSDAILVKDISVSGVDLANLAVSGKIINVTRELFDLDLDVAMMSGLSAAIGSFAASVNDYGIGDLAAQVAAKQSGNADPATMRTVFSGLAQGTLIGLLAGVSDAPKIASSVSDFIAGKAKNLSIEATPKDPAGMSFMEFAMAQENPKLLLEKVDLNATAN
jgi:hypothetical protein